MNMADRIQHLRKNKGISQEELADKVGVSRQAVSKWESEQSTPDIEKVILLSNFFDVTTKYFVQKELDIRGSRNAMPEDFRAVIHYLQNGNCPMNELISAVVKPEEAGEALQKWSENPGKVFRMLVEF